MSAEIIDFEEEVKKRQAEEIQELVTSTPALCAARPAQPHLYDRRSDRLPLRGDPQRAKA